MTNSTKEQDGALTLGAGLRHPECFEKYDILHECCTECGQKEDCLYINTAVESLSGAEAHELTEEIDGLIKAGNVHFFKAGILISRAIEGKAWKILGYESADAWMSGRLGLTPSTGRQYRTLAETYAKYVVDGDTSVAQIGYTRLRDMHPFFSSAVAEGEREEWIEKAKALSGADFRNAIREARGLMPSDGEHAHDWQHYSICKICGQKRKGTR